jgi:hypothetical protein
MRVSEIRLDRQGSQCTLRAQVTTDKYAWLSPFTLCYRFPAELLPALNPDRGDPFLAALLLPAMVAGEPLELAAPVSPRLLRSVSTIQAVYHCWARSLAEVPVRTPLRPPAVPARRHPQRAAFFSLGVDSFYTLLKNVREHPQDEETITHLIVVQGFDLHFDGPDSHVFPSVLAASQEVAEELGKQVLPVATNLRDFVDLFVDWNYLGHGAAMASVGLALETLFGAISIAASNSYEHLYPIASHPLLDPMWSTEALTFIHDGCERRRFEKIEWIAEYPIALDRLRICYSFRGDPKVSSYNCGQCEKCLKSMLYLHNAGALEKCQTLPHIIDLERVRQLPSQFGHNRTQLEWAFNGLKDSEEDRPLRAALREALENNTNPPQSPNKWKTYSQWIKPLHEAVQEIEALIPEGSTVVLADQAQWPVGSEIAGSRLVPFPEEQGEFGGRPDDDQAAIQEVERQRQTGAGFMVVAWPAFWWLDYYSGLSQYLRNNFPCRLENDRLVIFELRS